MFVLQTRDRMETAFLAQLPPNGPLRHLPESMISPSKPKSRRHSVAFAFFAAVTWLSTTISALAVDSIFPDKALEAAVRREVFAKRNTDQPITAEDVKKISRVVSKASQIVSLEGLQHCHAIMEIDLENNAIVDLGPLKELKNVQTVNLAGNRIESIAALNELRKLQYLELSRNQIVDLSPLAEMTNMRSLYLNSNRIRSLEPLKSMKKLWTLHAAENPIEDFSAIESLSWLSSLNLSKTGLRDLKSLRGLMELNRLTISANKIEDLKVLVEMCEADAAGPKKFASYLKLDVRDNPLGKSAHAEQLDKLKQLGVRTTLTEEKP